MKLLGGVIMVVSTWFGLVGSPICLIGSVIGLLIFLQGIQNAIVEDTTEYVRRAITENKTYDDLEKERLGHEESGGYETASNQGMDTTK